MLSLLKGSHAEAKAADFLEMKRPMILTAFAGSIAVSPVKIIDSSIKSKNPVNPVQYILQFYTIAFAGITHGWTRHSLCGIFIIIKF